MAMFNAAACGMSSCQSESCGSHWRTKDNVLSKIEIGNLPRSK